MSYFPVLLVGLAGVALSAWIAGLRYQGRQVPRVLQGGRLICAAACAFLALLAFNA